MQSLCGGKQLYHEKANEFIPDKGKSQGGEKDRIIAVRRYCHRFPCWSVPASHGSGPENYREREHPLMTIRVGDVYTAGIAKMPAAPTPALPRVFSRYPAGVPEGRGIQINRMPADPKKSIYLMRSGQVRGRATPVKVMAQERQR
jgi:hypothetical protein